MYWSVYNLVTGILGTKEDHILSFEKLVLSVHLKHSHKNMQSLSFFHVIAICI